MDIAKSRNFLLTEIKVNNPSIYNKILDILGEWNLDVIKPYDEEVWNVLKKYNPTDYFVTSWDKYIKEINHSDQISLYNKLKEIIK